MTERHQIKTVGWATNNSECSRINLNTHHVRPAARLAALPYSNIRLLTAATPQVTGAHHQQPHVQAPAAAEHTPAQHNLNSHPSMVPAPAMLRLLLAQQINTSHTPINNHTQHTPQTNILPPLPPCMADPAAAAASQHILFVYIPRMVPLPHGHQTCSPCTPAQTRTLCRTLFDEGPCCPLLSQSPHKTRSSRPKRSPQHTPLLHPAPHQTNRPFLLPTSAAPHMQPHAPLLD